MYRSTCNHRLRSEKLAHLTHLALENGIQRNVRDRLRFSYFSNIYFHFILSHSRICEGSVYDRYVKYKININCYSDKSEQINFNLINVHLLADFSYIFIKNYTKEVTLKEKYFSSLTLANKTARIRCNEF